jgi:hypothetical protein
MNIALKTYLYAKPRTSNHQPLISTIALPAAGLYAHTTQGLSHGPVSALIPNANWGSIKGVLSKLKLQIRTLYS